MVAQLDRAYISARPSRVWTRLVSYLLFEGRPLTTRGRWINPVLFGLYRVLVLLPPLRECKAPIFIMGTGRSGTTALGTVLSMHKEIGFLNEPKALWHACYQEEDIIGSYAKMHGRARLWAMDATQRTHESLHRLYGAYLWLSRNRRVLDKYPELVFRIDFVRALFPDAKFLFLCRNGWDTCSSISDWSEKHGTFGEDWWGRGDQKWRTLVQEFAATNPEFSQQAPQMMTWSDHRHRAAFEWIISMRAGLAAQADDPDGILTVPYEGLCKHPEQWMKAICTFAGLRPDPTLFAFAASKLRPVDPKPSFPLPATLEKAFAEVTSKVDAVPHQPNAGIR